MTVIPLEQRMLGQSAFACSERLGDGTWPITVEAWTKYDLDEVLTPERRTKFLAPIQRNAQVGDTIEVFQVADTERPERDPLAMASFVVSHFETDRYGTRMHTTRHGETLWFSGVTGQGFEYGRWRGKECVYKDGKRVGEWSTRIEAIEQLERLRDPNPKDFSERVNKRLDEIKARPEPRAILPPRHRCRHEDIAIAGYRKVSRVVEVRCLDPIENVLVDRDFFCVAKSRFRSGDRVTFQRFDSDARHRVIEILPLAIADIDAGRVKFYPQMPVSVIGSAEAGWVRETIKGRVHLRENGRTRETFANEERADWFCEENGIEAIELKARQAA